MSSVGEHERIIAAAAKAALGPSGFQRKGRSRVWLADCGYWLCAVEFQPSGFTKGSYLNVAAHWLWGVLDVLSFDYLAQDQRTFIEFSEATDFATLAAQQAADAASTSEALRSKFATIEATAAILAEMERSSQLSGRAGGWPAFNAAIAVGVTGDASAARSFFRSAMKSFEAGRPDLAEMIRELESRVGDQRAFCTTVEERINEHRECLGLARLPDGFLQPR